MFTLGYSRNNSADPVTNNSAPLLTTLIQAERYQAWYAIKSQLELRMLSTTVERPCKKSPARVYFDPMPTLSFDNKQPRMDYIITPVRGLRLSQFKVWRRSEANKGTPLFSVYVGTIRATGPNQYTAYITDHRSPTGTFSTWENAAIALNRDFDFLMG